MTRERREIIMRTVEWRKKEQNLKKKIACLFLGFLTSLSTTRLYRGRAPRQSV